MEIELQSALFSQGFGTRRICAGLVQQGLVRFAHGDAASDRTEWRVTTDATLRVATQDLLMEVQGVCWPYHECAYIMLHKPAGTECSQKPSTYPSVYTLLPAPLRQRPQKGPVQGVQAVGRLDQDTTGLLLLTDDGKFIHRMNSPRHHVPKRYEVQTVHALRGDECERLLAGVVLDDDPRPVRAAACVQVGPQALHLTLTEGKYHQVKRMVAAVGNRVMALHRAQVGTVLLDGQLGPGQWRWLTAQECAALGANA